MPLTRAHGIVYWIVEAGDTPDPTKGPHVSPLTESFGIRLGGGIRGFPSREFQPGSRSLVDGVSRYSSSSQPYSVVKGSIPRDGVHRMRHFPDKNGGRYWT